MLELKTEESGDFYHGVIQHQFHGRVVRRRPGYAVHPNGVDAQLQGGTIDGLSTALGLEITVKNGRVQQSNVDDYPLARIAAFPSRLETHILNYDNVPTGVGEIGIPSAAPALTNAIFAATGQRIRGLPVLDQLA